jgi:adenylyltransferase/sulfurtransferase
MRELGVKELARMLAAGEPVYLVDVRNPWEHETVALPDSLLAPLPELHEHADEIAPPPGALLVAYCHHGIRSRSAAVLLEQMGHANVVSLIGGIDAWSREIDPALRRY